MDLFILKTYLARGLQPHNFKSSWHNHALSLQVKTKDLVGILKKHTFSTDRMACHIHSKKKFFKKRCDLKVRQLAIGHQTVAHLVIGRWDAIKHLQPLQSSLASLGFVGQHACWEQNIHQF